MRFWPDNTEKSTERKALAVDDYLKDLGLDADDIKIVENVNLIEDYFYRHRLSEDTLRTVEGRKGAELRHRLTARMIVLYALLAPMVIIPFWLMWILLPSNSKSYSERMQGAFLAALASNVLGLCWVVTRDLYPQGGPEREQDGEDPDAIT
ncbi:MAG TPA: hypothetical protein VLS96_13040 [Nodosilinea sp.]|nr:hypothetical protein [Nodosilinea sp.]